MQYISTRGEAQAVGFLDAVLVGLAPDGGLFVPKDWPAFTTDEIAAFSNRPYAEVAAAVLGKFAGPSIPKDALLEMCQEAYATFSHPAVTPIKQLYPGLFLLELFHGRRSPSRTSPCRSWRASMTTFCLVRSES